MIKHPTYQAPLLPELQWPKLKWQAKMLFTVIPFLLSFLVFFYPPIANSDNLNQIRLAIGIPLFLAPILIPLVIWLIRASAVSFRRVKYYPKLYIFTFQEISELDQLKRNFFELATNISNNRIFEIIKAAYHQEKLFISVKKRADMELMLGDTLTVVHTEDGLLMGLFKITEIREIEYYAAGTSNIDPLWLGYIRQQGEGRINPYMAAISLPQGESR